MNVLVDTNVVISAVIRDRLPQRVIDEIHGGTKSTAKGFARIQRKQISSKLMIRDLSTGGVIRQHRETTTDGHFLAKQVPTRRGKKTTLESAFEDSKQYELTQLGTQFVHYAMTELVLRIGSGSESAADS